MTSIRCSSLNVARHCTGAPALLARTSTETDETRTGTIAHEWIARYLQGGRATANDWLIASDWDDLYDELQDFADWYEATLAPQLPGRDELWRHEWAQELDLGGNLLTGHFDALTWGCEQAIVIDWKHGPGQRWILPPIGDDLQMLGYAVLAARGVDSVRVLRVLVTDLEYQEVVLPPEALIEARETIAGILREVAARPEAREPGPHCEHCLARRACPERLAAIESVTDALVPFRGGEIALTSDQARRVALALGPLEEAIKGLRGALRRQLDAGLRVEMHGKRLALVGSGSRDRVADPLGAITELRARIGDGADQAISTSKSALEKACKAAGADFGALLTDLRTSGAIVAEECEQQIRWVKA